MKKIVGIDDMTPSQIAMDVQNGGKFVVYKYAVSIIILTFRNTSNIYFVRPGESAVSKCLGFTLLALVAGWWGIPWGPIYTVTAVGTNLRGGKDVTQAIMASLTQQNAVQDAMLVG